LAESLLPTPDADLVIGNKTYRFHTGKSGKLLLAKLTKTGKYTPVGYGAIPPCLQRQVWASNLHQERKSYLKHRNNAQQMRNRPKFTPAKMFSFLSPRASHPTL